MRRDTLTQSVGCEAKPDDTGWPGSEGGKMARRGEPANVSPTSDFALSVADGQSNLASGSRTVASVFLHVLGSLCAHVAQKSRRVRLNRLFRFYRAG